MHQRTIRLACCVTHLPPRSVNETTASAAPRAGAVSFHRAQTYKTSIFEPFPSRDIPAATNMDILSHLDEVFFIQPPLLPSFIKRMEHKRQRNTDEQSPHRGAFRVSLRKTYPQIQIINSGEKHQGHKEPFGAVAHVHELTVKVGLACMQDWRFNIMSWCY